MLFKNGPGISLIISDRNSPLTPFQKVVFNYILDDCYCFSLKQLLRNNWTCLKLFPTHNHSQSRHHCLGGACSCDARCTLLSSTLRSLTLVTLSTQSYLGSAFCLGPCDLCFSEEAAPYSAGHPPFLSSYSWFQYPTIAESRPKGGKAKFAASNLSYPGQKFRYS